MTDRPNIQAALSGVPAVESSPKLLSGALRALSRQRGIIWHFLGERLDWLCYDLAVRSGVKFDAHYSQTTVDPPEVQRFIGAHYPDVAWEKPRDSMFRLIVKNGIPPHTNDPLLLPCAEGDWRQGGGAHRSGRRGTMGRICAPTPEGGYSRNNAPSREGEMVSLPDSRLALTLRVHVKLGRIKGPSGDLNDLTVRDEDDHHVLVAQVVQ